jgi:hypothetical protein
MTGRAVPKPMGHQEIDGWRNTKATPTATAKGNLKENANKATNPLKNKQT